MLIDRAVVSNLCRLADERLWQAWSRAHKQRTEVRGTHLLFPQYRGGRSIRVSEQEARLAFIESVIADSGLLFSIETPTDEQYSFSGVRPMSGQTDLSIHNSDGSVAVRVEFKAKGASLARKSNLSINKDVEKLLREPVLGLWYHVFKSVDSTTISKLTSVLASAISTTLNDHQVRNTHLGIHICVLDAGYSIQRWQDLASARVSCQRLIEQLDFAPGSGWTPQPGHVQGGWHVHVSQAAA